MMGRGIPKRGLTRVEKRGLNFIARHMWAIDCPVLTLGIAVGDKKPFTRSN
jgi:hypothetical protein